MQMGRINRAHVRCCEEADLASLGWICDAQQRCTDAALMLDASTRVAAAARSGLIDLRFAPPRFDVSHFSARLFCRPYTQYKWSLINTPFVHVHVTRRPDLLTSCPSRLPGSSPQATSRPVRARSVPGRPAVLALMRSLFAVFVLIILN